jgi:hypothetical protein
MSSLTASAGFAAAAGPLRLRTSFVHINSASADLASIQAGNGLISFFAICHLYETESPRTSGFAVSENADAVDCPIRFEDLAQLILGSIEAEVPNENIFHAAPLFVVANRGEYSGKQTAFLPGPQVRREYSKS